MKELIFIVLICGSIGLSYTSEKQQCCQNGQILTRHNQCGMDSIIRMNCTAGRMLLQDIILDGDKLSTVDTPGYTFVEDVSQYCIGRMYRNESRPELGLVPIALVCFEKVSTADNDIETSGVLTLISVLFLLATLGVYTYLPQMRDLQGLCYMCMCASMALGFLFLGILQLGPYFMNEICTITGFLVYTWMLATFFWMNVICINIFRSVVDPSYMKKSEKKQYFWYSCYAWGSTMLFLMVALFTNFVEGDHYKPGFGKNSCWFHGIAETWIFFYGPIGILITFNVILFILSSINLWRHTNKYEVNKLNNLKYKFLLSFKLFLVMGVSWTFELISFAHGQSHIVWKIMDTFNCLQGVIIFLLLVVFRRRAIQGLAQENCLPAITRPLAEKLSPHDDAYDQHILADDTTEVRLN